MGERIRIGEHISDEQWTDYQRDGVLRLGKVAGDDELAAMQAEMDAIMLGTADVDYDRMLMQLDGDSGAYSNLPPQSTGHKGATLEYRKIQQLEYDAVFLAWMQKPVFREVCAEVYGRHAPIAVYRAMFMNKPARKGSVLPWHQDGGTGWGIDRDPLVTVWTALDPATRANGCVEVIPGSHRLGLLSEDGHTISDEHTAMYAPDDAIVYLELEPGEVALLHNWLLHRSGVNRSHIARRGFSACYMHGKSKHEGNGTTWPRVFGDGALTVDGVRALVREGVGV